MFSCLKATKVLLRNFCATSAGRTPTCPNLVVKKRL
jgi:hypothetical protein